MIVLVVDLCDLQIVYLDLPLLTPLLIIKSYVSSKVNTKNYLFILHSDILYI